MLVLKLDRQVGRAPVDDYVYVCERLVVVPVACMQTPEDFLLWIPVWKR